MSFCNFSSNKKGTRCPACGYELQKDYRDIPGRICDSKEGIGPGTRLKNFLEHHGVTEEWYRNLKEKVGLVPECNCEMRRRYLDETWAAWQAGGWKSAKIAYDRVKEFYAKPV